MNLPQMYWVYMVCKNSNFFFFSPFLLGTNNKIIVVVVIWGEKNTTSALNATETKDKLWV